MSLKGESTDLSVGVEVYFSIDHEGSTRLCADAKAAMLAGQNHNAVQDLILRSLKLRPSSMLAYSLLAQQYRSAGNNDLALQCQRGLLPAELLDTLAEGVTVCPQGESLTVELLRTLVHAEEQYEIPQAIELASGAPKIAFADEALIRSGPCFIDRIEGAKVWHDTRHTMVWDKEFTEVSEHTLADRSLISLLSKNQKPFRIQGRAFLIGARGAHNFYHWMTDIIPKLGLLKSAGFTFTPSDRFIVPHADSSFSRQLLQVFGVSGDQIYATEREYTYLSADELIVPYMHNKMGLTMGSWLPQMMRTAFKLKAKVAADSDQLCLYVQRKAGSSDGRQVVNEAELLDVLHQAGFECVQAETLSVVEQANLFSRASVVVAAHGAALTNIMFCKPGTRVIELYASHLAPCYRAISALGELQYWRLYCGDDQSGHSLSDSDKRSGNLTVPLEPLRKVLA